MAAGSATDRADRHRRRRAEAFGKHGENRRAGGRGQFAFDVRFGQGNADEQLGRGGRGNAALAVRDSYLPRTGRHRRRDEAFDRPAVPVRRPCPRYRQSNRPPRPRGNEPFRRSCRELWLPPRPSGRKILFACSFARGGNRPASIIAEISCKCRWACLRRAMHVDLQRAKALPPRFFDAQPALGQAQRSDARVEPIEVGARHRPGRRASCRR